MEICSKTFRAIMVDIENHIDILKSMPLTQIFYDLSQEVSMCDKIRALQYQAFF
jgi:hypothetical protein